MTKHKSEDYKLSAVKYFLENKKSFIPIRAIFSDTKNFPSSTIVTFDVSLTNLDLFQKSLIFGTPYISLSAIFNSTLFSCKGS